MLPARSTSWTRLAGRLAGDRGGSPALSREAGAQAGALSAELRHDDGVPSMRR